MKYRITKQYESTGRAYYVAQYLDEKNGLWKSLTQDKVFCRLHYTGLQNTRAPSSFQKHQRGTEGAKKEKATAREPAPGCKGRSRNNMVKKARYSILVDKSRGLYILQYSLNGTCWYSFTNPTTGCDIAFTDLERAKKVIKRLQNGRVLHHY